MSSTPDEKVLSPLADKAASLALATFDGELGDAGLPEGERRPWVVCKFGGTSVASAANWARIAARARALVTAGSRVWLVVSAVSGVTNALLGALEDALAPEGALVDGEGPNGRGRRVGWLVATHEALAADLGIAGGLAAVPESAPLLAGLRALLAGAALTREASPRLRARVAAVGELLSSALGAAYLSGPARLNAVRVDARSLLVAEPGVGSDAYLEADVKPCAAPRAARAAAAGADVVICQGFIAATPDGATCLLGRGGSDTSGTLFAAFVGAKRCEIWTDVNGMMTADPRQVPRARLIRSLTYREAQELAALGAKVLHPRCLIPAVWARIDVEVRNTMDDDPGAELTVISRSGHGGGGGGGDDAGTIGGARPSPPPSPTTFLAIGAFAAAAGVGGAAAPSPPSAAPCKVLAVARRKGITLVNVTSFDMWGNAGFLARVFAPFAAHGVSVDLIATSQYAVSLTLDHIPDGPGGEPLRRVLAELGSFCATAVRSPCAVVSVVGRALRNALPRLGAAMAALEGVPVYLVTEAAEDLNLSFVVDEEHADGLVARLHAGLLESDEVEGDAQFGPVWTDLPCGRAQAAAAASRARSGAAAQP